MGVALIVGDRSYPVGAASFLNAFFSTLHVKVEKGAWGSRFPKLMNRLYQGQLGASECAAALEELRTAREELAKLPPSEVVWDFEDPGARPPWGTNIAPSITSLANYFRTSDGKDLLDVACQALELGRASGRGVRIG